MSGKKTSSKPKGKILVIGGNGFYGRYLVNDLIQHTNADIVVASRNPANTEWDKSNRIQVARCDMADVKLLEQLAVDSNVVVHCAGPFQALPLNPLHAAIRTKVNYIDISEDRTFNKEVQKLEESIHRAGIIVLSGMSVAP